MGLYDTILIPCPKCSHIHHAQSKSGDCSMNVFEIENAPVDVMGDVNRHAPFTCEVCRCVFSVEFPNPKINYVIKEQ